MIIRAGGGGGGGLGLVFVGCLTSQQHASVSQGQRRGLGGGGEGLFFLCTITTSDEAVNTNFFKAVRGVRPTNRSVGKMTRSLPPGPSVICDLVTHAKCMSIFCHTLWSASCG